jgi:hypothetical protein
MVAGSFWLDYEALVQRLNYQIVSKNVHHVNIAPLINSTLTWNVAGSYCSITHNIGSRRTWHTRVLALLRWQTHRLVLGHIITHSKPVVILGIIVFCIVTLRLLLLLIDRNRDVGLKRLESK